MVLVGNCGTLTGGLQVFPSAAPDDGVLDIAILSAKRLRDWASVTWRLLRHRPQRADLVHRLRGNVIDVQLDRPMPYEVDGELRSPSKTLHFAIEPGSILVRVPRPEVR